MKKSLHIDLDYVFGKPISISETKLQPWLIIPKGELIRYHNQSAQACLQQFDGLIGYINLLDLEIQTAIAIPVQVKRADIHIFYAITDGEAIQIRDLQQEISYSISSNRGRYFYLAPGDYELLVPTGRYTVVNFYFRGSIFRDGNERPFQFLHPLIVAYGQKDPNTCCSIDFRVGPRTILLMKAIMANIKKGDLDSEVNILWGIKKLIKLSKEKIFEEYEKISGSQLKSKEAHAAIKQAVAEYGQDFKLSDIAVQLNISKDYLHLLIHSYYGLSPQELKIEFMLDLAKKYVLDGMHTDTIAYELGYSAPSSFTRFFKRWTGMTASDFFNLNNQ